MCGIGVFWVFKKKINEQPRKGKMTPCEKVCMSELLYKHRGISGTYTQVEIVWFLHCSLS